MGDSDEAAAALLGSLRDAIAGVVERSHYGSASPARSADESRVEAVVVAILANGLRAPVGALWQWIRGAPWPPNGGDTGSRLLAAVAGAADLHSEEAQLIGWLRAALNGGVLGRALSAVFGSGRPIPASLYSDGALMRRSTPRVLDLVAATEGLPFSLLVDDPAIDAAIALRPAPIIASPAATLLGPHAASTSSTVATVAIAPAPAPPRPRGASSTVASSLSSLLYSAAVAVSAFAAPPPTDAAAPPSPPMTAQRPTPRSRVGSTLSSGASTPRVAAAAAADRHAAPVAAPAPSPFFRTVPVCGSPLDALAHNPAVCAAARTEWRLSVPELVLDAVRRLHDIAAAAPPATAEGQDGAYAAIARELAPLSPTVPGGPLPPLHTWLGGGRAAAVNAYIAKFEALTAPVGSNGTGDGGVGTLPPPLVAASAAPREDAAVLLGALHCFLLCVPPPRGGAGHSGASIADAAAAAAPLSATAASTTTHVATAAAPPLALALQAAVNDLPVAHRALLCVVLPLLGRLAGVASSDSMAPPTSLFRRFFDEDGDANSPGGAGGGNAAVSGGSAGALHLGEGGRVRVVADVFGPALARVVGLAAPPAVSAAAADAVDGAPCLPGGALCDPAAVATAVWAALQGGSVHSPLAARVGTCLICEWPVVLGPAMAQRRRWERALWRKLHLLRATQAVLQLEAPSPRRAGLPAEPLARGGEDVAALQQPPEGPLRAVAPSSAAEESAYAAAPHPFPLHGGPHPSLLALCVWQHFCYHFRAQAAAMLRRERASAASSPSLPADAAAAVAPTPTPRPALPARDSVLAVVAQLARALHLEQGEGGVGDGDAPSRFPAPSQWSSVLRVASRSPDFWVLANADVASYGAAAATAAAAPAASQCGTSSPPRRVTSAPAAHLAALVRLSDSGSEGSGEAGLRPCIVVASPRRPASIRRSAAGGDTSGGGESLQRRYSGASPLPGSPYSPPPPAIKMLPLQPGGRRVSAPLPLPARGGGQKGGRVEEAAVAAKAEGGGGDDVFVSSAVAGRNVGDGDCHDVGGAAAEPSAPASLPGSAESGIMTAASSDTAPAEVSSCFVHLACLTALMLDSLWTEQLAGRSQPPHQAHAWEQLVDTAVGITVRDVLPSLAAQAVAAAVEEAEVAAPPLLATRLDLASVGSNDGNTGAILVPISSSSSSAATSSPPSSPAAHTITHLHDATAAARATRLQSALRLDAPGWDVLSTFARWRESASEGQVAAATAAAAHQPLPYSTHSSSRRSSVASSGEDNERDQTAAVAMGERGAVPVPAAAPTVPVQHQTLTARLRSFSLSGGGVQQLFYGGSSSLGGASSAEPAPTPSHGAGTPASSSMSMATTGATPTGLAAVVPMALHTFPAPAKELRTLPLAALPVPRWAPTTEGSSSGGSSGSGGGGSGAHGTSILSVWQSSLLAASLPLAVAGDTWVLAYSLARHGASLPALVSRARDFERSLVVIQDESGAVFGGYAAEPWSPSRRHASTSAATSGRYFGNGTSFVFSFGAAAAGEAGEAAGGGGAAPASAPLGVSPTLAAPPFEVWRWSRANAYFQLLIGLEGGLAGQGIGMGGGGSFAFFLDGELCSGSTGGCETFHSPPLCGAGPHHHNPQHPLDGEGGAGAAGAVATAATAGAAAGTAGGECGGGVAAAAHFTPLPSKQFTCINLEVIGLVPLRSHALLTASATLPAAAPAWHEANE